MNEPTMDAQPSAGGASFFALEQLEPRGSRPGLRSAFPLDVQLDDRNVYAPDVVWYREGRAPAAGRLAAVSRCRTSRSRSGRHRRGASTSASRRPTTSATASAELWLVDTAADVVLVFRRSSPRTPQRSTSASSFGLGETLTSPLLPGFELAVGEIFGWR